MFFVAGATGQTGKAVAEELLKAGKKVRVLVRDAAKAAGLAAQGAEVVTGSLEDSNELTKALKGVQGAYLLLPSSHATPDFLNNRRHAVDQYAVALANARVPKLVFLSSVAADLPQGTGPIASVRYAEQALQNVVPDVSFLRPAYFLENWSSAVGGVKAEGVLHHFFDPRVDFEMVATEDIGRTGAQELISNWKGKRFVNVAGPKRYSVADVVAAFAQVSGRNVTAVSHPLAAVVPTLTSFGFTAEVAGLYAEMIEGLSAGRLFHSDTGLPLVRGTVTPEQVFASWFAKE